MSVKNKAILGIPLVTVPNALIRAIALSPNYNWDHQMRSRALKCGRRKAVKTLILCLKGKTNVRGIEGLVES